MKKRLSRLLSIAVLGFTVLLLGDASAAPITKTITVQVYQFCDDAGLNCASTGPAGNAYFAAETNKIWNQASMSTRDRCWRTTTGSVSYSRTLQRR